MIQIDPKERYDAETYLNTSFPEYFKNDIYPFCTILNSITQSQFLQNYSNDSDLIIDKIHSDFYKLVKNTGLYKFVNEDEKCNLITEKDTSDMVILNNY